MVKKRRNHSHRKKHGIEQDKDTNIDEAAATFLGQMDNAKPEADYSQEYSNEPKIEREDKTMTTTQTNNNESNSYNTPGPSSPSSPIKDEIEQTDLDNRGKVLIGDYLREQREAKSISIKDLSQATKIGRTNLQLLESNQYDRLPNKTYVMGYIKSYARTLGIDQKYCIELAQDVYRAQEEKATDITIQENNAQQRDQGIIVKLVVGFGVFLLLIIGLVLINSGDNKTQQVAAEPVIENPAIKTVTSQTPLKNNETQETSEKTTEPVKAVEVANTATPKTETTKKEVPKVEEIKKETIKVEKVAQKPIKEPKKLDQKKDQEKKQDIKFSALATTLYEIDGAKKPEEIKELIPDRFRTAIISGVQNIYISARRGNSWLTYKSDDKPVKKFILKEGRSLLIRGKEVRLFLGNINVVDLFLDNKALKVQSPSGVKSLVFPQENGSKYKLPLFIYNKDGTVTTSDTI